MLTYTKECAKCKKTLPPRFFNKQRRNKDKLSSYCKTCVRELAQQSYLKNKDNRIKEILDWQSKNKQKVQKYNADFKQRHNAHLLVKLEGNREPTIT